MNNKCTGNIMKTLYTVALIILIIATLIAYGLARLLFSALLVTALGILYLGGKYHDRQATA